MNRNELDPATCHAERFLAEMEGYREKHGDRSVTIPPGGMTMRQAESILNSPIVKPPSGPPPVHEHTSAEKLRSCLTMLIERLEKEVRQPCHDEFDMVQILTEAVLWTNRAMRHQRIRDEREKAEFYAAEAMRIAGAHQKQKGQYGRQEADPAQPPSPGLPGESQPPGAAGRGEAAAAQPRKELREPWAGDWLKGT